MSNCNYKWIDPNSSYGAAEKLTQVQEYWSQCDDERKIQVERAKKAEEEAKSWRTIAMNHLDARDQAEVENARLREYVATVAKYCVELGYQAGHEHTVDGHYAPPSEYDYDIFNGINLMEVDV